MENKISQNILPPIKISHYSLAETEIVDKPEVRESVNISTADEIIPSPLSIAPPQSDTDSLDEHLAKDYTTDRRVFLVIFLFVTLITISLISIIVHILINLLQGFNFHPDLASIEDYNIHLVCLVIGSLILPAYGMLIFRIFPKISYSTLVNYHIAINILGLILSVFGIKVAYDAHHIFSSQHLYSLHSWFGFTIFILQFIELITGNWLYFRSFPQPIMKYCHSVSGSIIFVWSGAATISGFAILFSVKIFTDDVVFTLNAFGVLTNLFAILVRYLCSEYRFRRRSAPKPTKPSSSSSSSNPISRFNQSLAPPDPFTQDTFEYGAARKSIFITPQTYQEFTESLNKTATDDGSDDNDDNELTTSDNDDNTSRHRRSSQFYEERIMRRGTLTRQSIIEDLAKLSHLREINPPTTSRSSELSSRKSKTNDSDISTKENSSNFSRSSSF